MNLGGELQNANPVVVQSSVERRRFFSPGSAAGTSDPYLSAAAGSEELDAEPFDALEVDINDPEHPLTLEQLSVAQLDLVRVDDERNEVMVHFTPTIPHCSMATLIGLCIRVKLLRSLPRRFKVTVLITPGTHASEEAVNKQLNDKERIAAATENKNLLQVINKCLSGQEAF